MDLSYTLHHPSFAMRGMASLNTRPFLTVHRSRYDTVPRLFPSQLRADVLLQPPLEQCQNSHAYCASPRKRAKLLNEQLHHSTAYHACAHRGRASDLSCAKSLETHARDQQQVANANGRIAPKSRLLRHEAWRTSKTEVVAPLCLSTFHLDEAVAEEACTTPTNGHLTVRTSSGNYMTPPAHGNLLSSIGSDGQGAVAFSPTGLLSSLMVAKVQVESNQSGTPVHVLREPTTVQQVPDFVLSDSSVMYDLVCTTCATDTFEAHNLLATTANAVSLAVYDVHTNHIQWRDQFALQEVTSTAFNPVFPEEFSVLCEDGLFSGTAEQLHEYTARVGSYAHFADVQPVSRSTSARFQQIHYGAHPRSVLLSNGHGVWRHDWRMHGTNTAGDVVFDVREHWALSKRGVKVGAFQPLKKSSAFQMVVATNIALMYMDVRMAHTPLLDWSLSAASMVDHMSVCEAAHGDTRFDVIALSCRKNRYLEVFHAVHEAHEEAFGVEMGDVSKRWRAQSPRCEVVWSDLPLAHLQKLERATWRAGVLLMAHSQTDLISLVQWSASDGVQAQLLGVGVFPDGKRDFEEGEEQGAQYVDNSMSVWKQQKRLVEVGEHTAPYLVSNCLVGGVAGCVLHRRTRQMFWKDAVDLRERVCRDDDDDDDGDGDVGGDGRCCTRIPRPYVGDIWFIARYREQQDGGMATATATGNEQHCESGAQSQSQRCSEGDKNEMREFGEVLCGGCTLWELARCSRSGLAHCRTPLGVRGLEESVEQSAFVSCSSSEWHSTCVELHDGALTQVDCNEQLPDWVNMRVYYSSQQPQQAARWQPREHAEYAQLVRRMRAEFESFDCT
eukprot:TRINITY_DN1441_c0_g2_i1.p1 TRINITY_DN1441_c0_g2~~TRINITY_DN1441_c0_g2_i1.p1  ORF type:complete len:838 (+),score=138.15 TRINITY_DN1441_c0_g2_i1:1890-4403(+)